MHDACTMSPCSRNFYALSVSDSVSKCFNFNSTNNKTKSRTSNSAFTTIEGEITTLLARLLVLAVGLWGALRVVGAREALFQRDILRRLQSWVSKCDGKVSASTRNVLY